MLWLQAPLKRDQSAVRPHDAPAPLVANAALPEVQQKRLFATALGLVAAIPAVTFYNKFASQLAGFGDRLDTFSQEFIVRLSRRLYERRGEG